MLSQILSQKGDLNLSCPLRPLPPLKNRDYESGGLIHEIYKITMD